MDTEMKNKIGFKAKVVPYLQAIPVMVIYQAVSKLFLWLILHLLQMLFLRILESSGRVALSSGDLQFLFSTWQGIVLLPLGLAVLFLYTIFDINAMIVICGKLLKGEKPAIVDSLRQAFLTIPKLFSLRGIGIILYIALLAPLLNIGVSVSLTKNFYIPTFITSVIDETPLYSLLYNIVLTFFMIIGLINIFSMHGIVLDKMSISDACRQSRQMMKKHWVNYLLRTAVLTINLAVVSLIYALVFLLLPLILLSAVTLNQTLSRFFTILICTAAFLFFTLIGFLMMSYQFMIVTRLYETYKTEETVLYPIRKGKKHPLITVGIALLILAVINIFSGIATDHFDEAIPAEVGTQIIAHRAGGKEAPENTVAGINAAAKNNAWGSEIDIQRTKDGYYVLNHDDTFKRLCGVNKKPENMTLEEIRALSIKGEPIPTLEEILEASRDKVILFIELKGASADKQMAEDTVRILREMNMEDQCVIISLKYNLIKYIEENYPEIDTGYLAFFSFGKTASLDCDYLGLEEETATSETIDAIHEEGKKIMVWTPNEENAQHHFLCSSVDAIITDNIVQTSDITRELMHRDDLTRILDAFFR